jgi:hypothetical protein
MIQTITFLAQASFATTVPVDFPPDAARPWLVRIDLADAGGGKIRHVRIGRKRRKGQERRS